MSTLPPIPAAVAEVIDTYPEPARAGVLALRSLIYSVAGAEPLTETLKWGQPAYLPTQARTGTTLRLGLHENAAFALFAHCQSTVIHDYANAFPDWDRIDGNRAILFDKTDDIEPERLSHLIRHALRYHLARGTHARA